MCPVRCGSPAGLISAFEKGRCPSLFYTSDVAIQFPDCDESMDVCDRTLLPNGTQSFPWLTKNTGAGRTRFRDSESFQRRPHDTGYFIFRGVGGSGDDVFGFNV